MLQIRIGYIRQKCQIPTAKLKIYCQPITKDRWNLQCPSMHKNIWLITFLSGQVPAKLLRLHQHVAQVARQVERQQFQLQRADVLRENEKEIKSTSIILNKNIRLVSRFLNSFFLRCFALFFAWDLIKALNTKGKSWSWQHSRWTYGSPLGYAESASVALVTVDLQGEQPLPNRAATRGRGRRWEMRGLSPRAPTRDLLVDRLESAPAVPSVAPEPHFFELLTPQIDPTCTYII